jgi:predicted CxxxxCH...CXXCH cytochrome family protein
MPQIKLPLIAIFIAAGLTLSGCGDRNSQVNFNADKAAHLDANWVKSHPAAATAAMDSCTECHGSNYAGGISQVSCSSATAQSGFRCHISSPADNPTGCVSCHGTQPAGPFGDTAPNRQFAHAVHTALLAQMGVTGKSICDTCHANGGYGTPDHSRATAPGGINSAAVILASGFEAKNPVAYGYNKTTGACSSVACHGGQSTPAWSGSIDIVADNNTICLQCHQIATPPALGTPQNNSFYSGSFSGTTPPTNLHMSHLARGANCTGCHNIGALTNNQQHFGGIAINSVSFTAPGNTIGNKTSLNGPTSILNYITGSQTCSGVACHPQFDRKWNN